MTRARARPDFFVVGAPRCGTTALVEYLRSHAAIGFSEPKEPHFFATDFPNQRFAKTEAEYARCFPSADPALRAVGEGSVWYLYSREAAANIARYAPDARILVMVRNPVDMVPSIHARLLAVCEEDVEEFSTAWRLQDARREGRELPASSREPPMLLYGEVGRFGEQLERLYRHFPREQVRVVLLDDLVADAQSVYESVLAFLGVPSDGRTDFPRINVNKAYRSRALAEIVHRPPGVVRGLVGLVNRLLGQGPLRALFTRFKKGVYALISADRPRPPLSDEMRAALADHYRDDVARLGKLLGRDLSHWTE